MSTASTWRVIAATFTVGVVVAGALVAWSLLRPGNVKTETTQQIFGQAISHLIFTDFEASDVIVVAGTAGEVKVRRELRWSGDDRPQADESWQGDTLVVSHNCGNAQRDDCSMRYTITVPPATDVVAKTAAGDVVVRDITGPIEAHAVSGDIQLSGSAGQILVETVSGDIQGTGLRSSKVETRGVSGDVRLVFAVAPQTVLVSKVSGDTQVKVPAGSGPYRVDVETTSGDRSVTVDRASGAERAIEVTSTSGDVSVAYA
ncbi:hypothetical protein Rhe02_46940 [Rhizocola hellebori]|uniref:DUF4097 domain-containing protein n=1 Tax=Rhizocola hellebori TaxID=1392758 RepID=A0A8J3VHU1_9ACTN|nr:DUF4097 family beta strand repeat-containing protein [Rhizocola hellebori]GIH06627.1 hypothetical protein Rhe02_46940 [Rhizocola hellebori]